MVSIIVHGSMWSEMYRAQKKIVGGFEISAIFGNFFSFAQLISFQGCLYMQ